MYNPHYGLKESPFALTPDTSFFFGHASHQEALNTLLVATRSGEGFMKVVGEVGTGKTLLCRKFLGIIEAENWLTAYIPNPYLEPMTLLRAVADELRVPLPEAADQHQVLKRLTEFLVEARGTDMRVLLCLDEAQAMPLETLEALRLLTNLETERSKLMQVVLFGQPELDHKLADPSIRQLRQRITFACRLGAFRLDDAEFYIAHRLSVAGYRGPRLFARDAVKRLQRASGGIPRLMNILAHKAMLAGFGEGARYITPKYVEAAIRDTESVPQRHRLRIWAVRTLAALAVLTLAASGAHLLGVW